jgi:hypothetical protein
MKFLLFRKLKKNTSDFKKIKLFMKVDGTFIAIYEKIQLKI